MRRSSTISRCPHQHPALEVVDPEVLVSLVAESACRLDRGALRLLARHPAGLGERAVVRDEPVHRLDRRAYLGAALVGDAHLEDAERVERDGEQAHRGQDDDEPYPAGDDEASTGAASWLRVPRSTPERVRTKTPGWVLRHGRRAIFRVNLAYSRVIGVSGG